MRFIDLIRKKRDGAELSREEIGFVISAYTRGDVPDYQMSAWLMAALLRGLNHAETTALTESMLHSGEVLDFTDLPAPKVDKHSTGGVGDKTSLVLAPLVAAGGLYIPMISGRGLGHTGGTLDKLEAIPGFNVNLSLEQFRKVLAKIGCGMIGQTAEIAPADKKIYALRDVSGTVESPPLICASIMSKKLAEGIDALVLDVKTGSGAFMKTFNDSLHLADLMVEAGERMNKRVAAMITGMDQPLGRAVGNALEVIECIELMRNPRAAAKDLLDLCVETAAWMFYLGDKVPEVSQGEALAMELLESGKALDRFRQMVELQGGDARVVDDLSLLPHAKHNEPLRAESSGYVHAVDCEAVGVASLVIGGGREKKEDAIDHAVGLIVHKKLGDAVEAGEPLFTVYYNGSERLHDARARLLRSYTIRPEPPASIQPLIRRVIAPQPRAARRS